MRKISKKNDIDFLEELYAVIKNRDNGKVKNSYTKLLLKKGKNLIAKKVNEESLELIIDYLSSSKKRTIEEAADLIFHVIVLLYSKKISTSSLEKFAKQNNMKYRH